LALPFIFCALLLCVGMCSYADTLHLKNKRTLEGIVTAETAADVILDVGCGTVTVTKHSIERIERSTQAQNDRLVNSWKDRYMDTGRWVPKDAEGLFTAFSKVKKKEQALMELKGQKENLQATIENRDRTLSGLYASYEEMSTQIKEMSKDDPEAYNKKALEINEMGAKINRSNHDVRLAERRKEAVTEEYADAMKDYIGSLAQVTNSFDEKYRTVEPAAMTQEQVRFYTWMQKALQALHGDFERREIACAKYGNGIVVDVVLNGTVKAALVVDTGASSVVISKAIADQLDIAESKKGKRVRVTLAGGKMTTAIPIILESVEVGNFKAKNVMAAIMEKAQDAHIDGLLGMSFLSNFLVRIEPNSGTLILEEFKPRWVERR